MTAATVHVEQPIVWTGLVGGLVGMSGVGLLAIAVIFEEPRRTPPGLPPAATWTWSESWASNLTALITALSALAAVFSDSLDPLVDQSVLVTFGLTTAALLVLAACAPLAYAVFQEVGPRLDPDTSDPGDPIPLNGTWYGWVIASALTVAAVEGSLAAAQSSIVLASDGALGVVVILVIILVQALVFAYAGRTFWLVMHTPHTDSLQSLLPGVTTERVRPGRQRPEIRMTLL